METGSDPKLRFSEAQTGGFANRTVRGGLKSVLRVVGLVATLLFCTAYVDQEMLCPS